MYLNGYCNSNINAPIIHVLGGIRLYSAYDGGKYVCLDDFTNAPDCLVYSMGMNNEISFEEDIIDLLGKGIA